MQLNEADKKLEELFPGKYRAVAFELSTYRGEQETKCSIYVEGGEWITAPTFQGALDLLIGAVEERQEIDA